jgi:hypothetical protein
MSTDFHVIFLIGATEYDVTDKVSAQGVSIEETLGGQAVATFRLQDRATPEWGPLPDVFPSSPPGSGGVNFERLDTKITIDGQTDPVFRGMVMSPTGEIRPGDDWPTYTIPCTDYQNDVFDRHLVGVPSGDLWWAPGPVPPNEYTPNDPNATAGSTDAATVSSLMAAYCGFPVIDTTAHVHEYVPDLIRGGYDTWTFDRTTLRGAFDQVAGYAAANVQYWIDTGFRLHWVAIPRWFDQQTGGGVSPRMLPETLVPLEAAPADIDNDAPNWTTNIACRAITWTLDYAPENAYYYVNGGVGFAYNGGAVEHGGTGWWPGNPMGAGPQALLDAPEAWDDVTKAAAANRAYESTRAGVLRGRFIVGHQNWHPDGWHVGQAFKLTDSHLPGFLNDRYYVIQKVTTTLIPRQNIRVYSIEWGDAPIQRLSGRKAPAIPKPPLPGRVWQNNYSENTPIPSATVRVTGQLEAEDGYGRKVANVPVHLAIETWDAADAPVIPPLGTLSATAVMTDALGRWSVDLTVASNPGYSYRVVPAAATP